MPGLHAQQCARATATSTGLDIGTLKSYMISVMLSLLAYTMCRCIVEAARRKVFPCSV